MASDASAATPECAVPAPTARRRWLPRTLAMQLTLAFLAVTLVTLTLAGIGVVTVVRAQSVQRVRAEMMQESSYLVAMLGRHAWPPQLSVEERRVVGESMLRLSLDSLVFADANGQLLMTPDLLWPFSSRSEGAQMRASGTVSARPEIDQALREGRDVVVEREVAPLKWRRGEATHIPVLFTATQVVHDGRVVGVVAMRRPLVDVVLFTLTLTQALALIGLLTIVVACLVAMLMSRWLTSSLKMPGI